MAAPGAGMEPGEAPPMPKMTGMLITLVIMIIVMMFYDQIGRALNYVFEPLIGFGGKYTVLTLIIAGILMTGISTIIRALMTDMVSQTRNQREMSAFNAELRQARREQSLQDEEAHRTAAADDVEADGRNIHDDEVHAHHDADSHPDIRLGEILRVQCRPQSDDRGPVGFPDTLGQPVVYHCDIHADQHTVRSAGEQACACI